MKKTLCVSIFLCFLSLSSVVIGADNLSSDRKVKCPVCGMFVAMFADWNARIEFKNSYAASFDGSKCMFKYFLDIKKYNPSKSKDDISAVWVNDYTSKTATDALRAYYVVWSDVYGPMGHEPIPFAKEADALKFMKEHNGKQIIRINDVDMKLIISLDNP